MKLLDIEILWKNKLIISLILSVVIFIIYYLLSNTKIFYILDKKLQNSYYSSFNIDINHSYDNQKKIHNDLVILEIDDKTLAYYLDKNTNPLWTFPFDRKEYIPVLDNLKSLWVSVIWIDIIFSESSNNKESDILLEKKIKELWNVVLWWFIRDNKFYDTFFKNSLKTSWFYNIIEDKYNFFVYSFKPLISLNKWKDIDHFSLSIIKEYLFKRYNFILNQSKYDDKYYYLSNDYKIPLAHKNNQEILINYSNYSNYKNQKKIYSFIDFYDKDIFEKNKRFYDLKGKIVLIWFSATWLKQDVYYTPNWIEQGLMINANIINTILNKDYLRYYNYLLEYIIVFIFILFSIYLNLFIKWYKLLYTNIFLIILLILYPFLFIYLSKTIINFPIEIIVSFIFALIFSNILKYILEYKKKSRLFKALWEYLSDDIAQKVQDTVSGLAIKTQKKKISIFFSDIVWFTSISEKFSAEILVEFLNEYLTEMTDIIEQANNGYVDKYEWDAIMAFWWNLKQNFKTQSYDISNAALLQQRKMIELAPLWKEKYWQELKIRIWIHTWEAIIWNIWSLKAWKKKNMTAIWDNVNLASRLEWINKFYNTNICASEYIYNEQKDNFEFRMLDKIRVKWKEKAIVIYELIWEKWSVDKKIIHIKNEFEIALNLYFTWNFKEALSIFENLYFIWDPVANVFILRIKEFLKNWAPKEWDWIWIMQEK